MNLELAVEKMLEACSDVNERKREHEEIEKQNLQVGLKLLLRDIAIKVRNQLLSINEVTFLS